MPTFNRADLILESVRSVIAQTFSNWELIVVDDGSTDDTIARIEALREPRIAVLRQARTGNVAKLRNLGIAAARGDYVAFLDSDDLWLPEKLEVQLRSLIGKPADWSYAAHTLVNIGGTRMPLRMGRFSPASGRIIRQLLAEETGATIITWLVPRALFDKMGGFDESLALQEDLDFVLRLAEAADAVAVPEVLALAREHPGRKTRSAAGLHRVTAEVFGRAAARLEHPSLRRLARQRQASHLASGAQALIAQGRLVQGSRLLGQALMAGAGLRRSMRAAAAGIWRALRRH